MMGKYSEIDIKKQVYKTKPIATFSYLKKGIAYYEALVSFEKEDVLFTFIIPVDDMGDAEFEKEIPAKLLLRRIFI